MVASVRSRPPQTYSVPVLTSCPVTGALIPTGVFAERVDDLPDDNLLRDCPECGADHFWDSDEVTLAYGRA